MSSIFLNEDQLEERIQNLLSRRDQFHGGEPSRQARSSVFIDRVSNSATINR